MLFILFFSFDMKSLTHSLTQRNCHYCTCIIYMYICLACLLMKCFLQVRYEGVRSRRKKGKLLDPETQEVRTQRVPADHTSCIIKGLTPKTLYTLNITATFRDSMTGADQMVKTYTRLLGKLGAVCLDFFSPQSTIQFLSNTIQFL